MGSIAWCEWHWKLQSKFCAPTGCKVQPRQPYNMKVAELNLHLAIFFFFHYQHAVASQHLICCFLLAPSCLSLPPSIPLSLLVVLLTHLKRRERHALYHTISNNHHYSASTELVRPASLSRADSASTQILMQDCNPNPPWGSGRFSGWAEQRQVVKIFPLWSSSLLNFLVFSASPSWQIRVLTSCSVVAEPWDFLTWSNCATFLLDSRQDGAMTCFTTLGLHNL